MKVAQAEYRLVRGQNLYDQPPFLGITQRVNSMFPSIPVPGLRAHMTLASELIAKHFGRQPSPDASQQLQIGRESMGGDVLSEWLTYRGYPGRFNNLAEGVNRALMGELANCPYWAIYLARYVSPQMGNRYYIADGAPNPDFILNSQRPPAETYLTYLQRQVNLDEKLMLASSGVLPAGSRAVSKILSSA